MKNNIIIYKNTVLYDIVLKVKIRLLIVIIYEL